MTTRYQLEVQAQDGEWLRKGTVQESMTAAEILATLYPGKKTRVVPVADGLSDKERLADVEMIKTLAEDLHLGQANYAATLESIVIRARRLFDEQAKRNGRGYRDGENTACQACDGVYPKGDR